MVPSLNKVGAKYKFLSDAKAYEVNVVDERRKAAETPVPLAVDVFTKMLFRRVVVGVLEIDTALDPKSAPELTPLIRTVL